MKFAPIAFVKKHPVMTVAAVGGGVLLLMLVGSGGKSGNATAVQSSGPSDAVVAAQAQGFAQTLAYNSETNRLNAETAAHLTDTLAARDVALATVDADVAKARISGDVQMFSIGTAGTVAMHNSDNELAGLKDTNASIVAVNNINAQVQHAALHTQQLNDSYHRNDGKSSGFNIGFGNFSLGFGSTG